MSLRNYTNTAPPLGLSPPGVESNTTVLTVPSTAGYPTPPFLLGIERGTGNEELCLCTAKTTTTFTVVRGFDNTPQIAHDPGAAVEHTVAAIEFREANQHVNDVNSHWSPGDMKVVAYAVTAGSEPAGWLAPDGRWVSKTTYADLWNKVGDTWLDGAAAEAGGAGTFRLPDMRGSFPMGKAASGTGSTLGSKGGFKDLAIPSHNHAVTDPGHHHGPGSHTHSTPAYTHTVNDPQHNHAGAAGFVYVVSIGGVQNDGVVFYGTTGRSNSVTYSDVHAVGTGITIGDHAASTTGSPSASNTADAGTGISLADPGVSPTDRNLPPWKSVNWLIKT